MLSISTHYHFHLNTKLLFTIFSEQVENFCPLPQIPATTILIQSKSSQRQPGKRTDSLYLWPRSYETVVKCRPFHRRRFLVATKVTNIGYRFSSRASVSGVSAFRKFVFESSVFGSIVFNKLNTL